MRREAGFVQAARLSGNGEFRILLTQILPNIMPIMVVQMSLTMGYAILNAAGLSFIGLGVRPPQAEWGIHTNWLSVFLVDEQEAGITRDDLILALDAAGVESRPVWKPMHMQPLYAAAECHGGDVAADIYHRGICLPSSSSLTVVERERVVAAIRGSVRGRVATRGDRL